MSALGTNLSYLFKARGAVLALSAIVGGILVLGEPIGSGAGGDGLEHVVAGPPAASAHQRRVGGLAISIQRG